MLAKWSARKTWNPRLAMRLTPNKSSRRKRKVLRRHRSASDRVHRSRSATVPKPSPGPVAKSTLRHRSRLRYRRAGPISAGAIDSAETISASARIAKPRKARDDRKDIRRSPKGLFCVTISSAAAEREGWTYLDRDIGAGGTTSDCPECRATKDDEEVPKMIATKKRQTQLFELGSQGLQGNVAD